MKLNKFYSFAFMLLITSVAFAQQLPQFTQYMFNTISINPAYAGSRETLSAVGLHRSQWVGLEGGPQTQTLSIHAPLRNEKIGLGVSVINDELGYENFQYVFGDFSYTVRTGTNSKLAFGVKAGITAFNLDADFRNDPDVTPDQLIFGIQDRMDFNVGAGVYWHSDRWYLGLSAPRILNNEYSGEGQFEALERVSYYFTGGYVFDLTDEIKLKPSALVKATNGAPISFDISANFLFNEKFWIGGGYRVNEQTNALGGIIDFQVSRQFRIGYAYEQELNNSGLRAFNNGTHEILLMFEIFKSRRIKSPRYF
ncbi:PorP/SprF family type IX secretion system membrane protein [Winogradskyella jejuensis]|uniref:Type IX secretion system membrane protein, PorP/SprF family n=1 Tax=Winogradskyella jejuensis TaxID=1089305 RepID=A0A1M5TJL4_9FLAO|nr:type IX secretion system membrane protein PorP/SprF [Winogradskyella jejuensis]SHH50957.1 type IX secretion system membrane protein, PorP/SprF family [Winogradskyella jejuensis]